MVAYLLPLLRPERCWTNRARWALQTVSAAAPCSIFRSKVAQRMPLGFAMKPVLERV